MRVLIVDNYDSFTYNLVQYLGELGADLEVVRNDAATVDELLGRNYDRVVVSPGPCTPNEAGISIEVVRRFPEAGVPTLGVCLGHQSLAQAFGGRVVRATPVHGKTTFDQFFARLDPAQQDRQFGKARAQMFRDGKITVKNLVSGSGRELTLEELRNH